MAMVSYTWDTLPPVSQEDIDRVAAMKDEDIDCSDMPDLRTLSLRLRVPTPDWGRPAQAKASVAFERNAEAPETMLASEAAPA